MRQRVLAAAAMRSQIRAAEAELALLQAEISKLKIDSSGLGVLVSLAKRIRDAGGELRLANLHDELQTLFELTKLDTLFQISTTRAHALESF